MTLRLVTIVLLALACLSRLLRTFGRRAPIWLLTTLGKLAVLVMLCIVMFVVCSVPVALLADSSLTLCVLSVMVSLVRLAPLEMSISVWCGVNWVLRSTCWGLLRKLVSTGIVA